MRRLDHTKLEVGDVFYSGKSDTPFTVVSPVREKTIRIQGRDHRQWRWLAVSDDCPGHEAFLITDGLEHYGPPIYSSPAYAPVSAWSSDDLPRPVPDKMIVGSTPLGLVSLALVRAIKDAERDIE